MDFQLSEEQKELQESVRRYARERLLPIAEEIETSELSVEHKTRDNIDFDVPF